MIYLIVRNYRKYVNSAVTLTFNVVSTFNDDEILRKDCPR